jgi:hypothetical protein
MKWVRLVLVFIIVISFTSVVLILFTEKNSSRSENLTVKESSLVPVSGTITSVSSVAGTWKWNFVDIVYTGECERAGVAETNTRELEVNVADISADVYGLDIMSNDGQTATGQLRYNSEDKDYAFSMLQGTLQTTGIFLINSNKIEGNFFGDNGDENCRYRGSITGEKGYDK